MEFPWRKYKREELKKDFKDLEKKLLEYDGRPMLSKSLKGYKFSNNFFQYNRLKTKRGDNTYTPYESWHRNPNRYIKYFEEAKQNSDLFSTVVYMTKALSQFSPYTSGCVYKFFNAKKVLDPYSGWGDRCLGAIALDIEYIGIDSNPDLKSCYNNMMKFLGDNDLGSSKCKFISSKSEDIIENVVSEFQPDLIFSSPPFWDKKKRIIEKYNNCENDYQVFFDTSLSLIIGVCIEYKITLCLYINEMMYDEIVKKFNIIGEVLHTKNTIIKKNKQLNTYLYYWYF